MQLQERIDASRMSSYQWLIVGLCIVLNALDGFDVLAMAFRPNSVTRDFALSGAELGVLLSADWSAWPSAPLVWPPLPTLSDAGP